MVRDEFVSNHCANTEPLYLGDFHVAEAVAELRFEGTAQQATLLVDLLCRAFGYNPLHPEAARIHTANPEVFVGDRCLGKLQDILWANLEFESFRA